MRSSASSSVRPRVCSFKSWSPGDLADGGLVDQLGVRSVGGDGGDGLDRGLAHDDGVALHVAEALAVADDYGVEHLLGLVLRHGARDDPPAGSLRRSARSPYRSRPCWSPWVSKLLGDHGLGVLAADDLRVAHGGVDAAGSGTVSICMLAALVQVDDGRGVHHALAGCRRPRRSAFPM